MKQRAVVLDTETTGLDPFKGAHRIVEIGCVEIVDFTPTGRTFHRYIDPERDVPSQAAAVHGLTQEFLAKFDPMQAVADDFLSFLDDSPLIIHNAPFDMKFLNAEMAWLGKEALSNHVIDTLRLARQKYPGSPASLDMLCARFKIDTTKRDKHGALLDAQLLASVYMEMHGGREPGFHFAQNLKNRSENVSATVTPLKRLKRNFEISEAEKQAHEAAMARLKA